MSQDAMTTPEAQAVPWEGIVRQVADALIYADREGVIRAWNAQAEAIFGYAASEVLGESLNIIIPEDLRQRHWDAFYNAMRSGMTRRGAEVRITRALHKDRERRLYVEMSFAVVVEAGTRRAVGSVAMARDGTERYLAEKAARRKAASGGH